MAEPPPDPRRSVFSVFIPTADRLATASVGAMAACLVVGAWAQAIDYAVFFFAIVLWKATR